MKQTKEAIRYCLETLDISPNELFKLFDVAQYSSEEAYDIWLAKEVLKIAESEDVGLSKLMIKKFIILQELKENYLKEKELSVEALNFIVDGLRNSRVISYEINNIEEDNRSDEEVNWFEGIDYGIENDFFMQNNEWLREKINDSFSMCLDLSSLSLERVDKTYKELASVAKEKGVECHNMASLLLFRLCLMEELYFISNAGVSVVLPVDFLSKPENRSILQFILDYFKVEGWICSSKDLYGSVFNIGDYAILMLSEKTESQQDISLRMLDGWKEVGEKIQCSLSKGYLKDKLESKKVDKDALFGVNLCTNPVTLSNKKGGAFVGIGEHGLRDAVIYYVLFNAMQGMERIRKPVEYKFLGDELFYNCLPLFIVGNCNDVNWFLKNKKLFDTKLWKILENEIETGRRYVGFEAKSLVDYILDFKDSDEKEFKKDNMFNMAVANLENYCVQLYRNQYVGY